MVDAFSQKIKLHIIKTKQENKQYLQIRRIKMIIILKNTLEMCLFLGTEVQLKKGKNISQMYVLTSYSYTEN